MDIIISSILEHVLTAAGAVSSLLIAAGIRYIFAKIKNDKLQSYGDLLAVYAEKAVKAVAQKEGEDLKEAAADGKLTDDEKAMLKKVAVDTLKAMAPGAILKFMAKGKSDIDTLLDTLVESAVSDSKGVKDNS